ncbi:hypothetical protein Tco_0542790 [Tanacetum coccineum]
MDEWSKSQNVSSKQTDRTNLPPPQAHTEHVNVVFTGSGKSDYSPKNLKDPPPPIIVDNKTEKDKPIKTSKRGYHVVKTNEYPFCVLAGNPHETVTRPLRPPKGLKASMHGSSFQIRSSFHCSNWLSIIREVSALKLQGVTPDPSNNKNVQLRLKCKARSNSLFSSPCRGGVETQQLENIQDLVRSKVLSNVDDRWAWDLNGGGDFCVKDARDPCGRGSSSKGECCYEMD